MEIKYNRNQYIRIDKSVEEIAKIKINFNNYHYNYKDKIEDLELEGDENVLINNNYTGNGDEFINIHRGVKIMITTEGTIKEDRYKKLPENVDYVIVDNRIYEVKDEFDMMRFMIKERKERFSGYIEEVKNSMINANNKNGEKALILACENKMERVAMELIPKMSEEAINKWGDNGRTALNWTCENKMERVAMELIPKMSEEAINKWTDDGNTVLYLVCWKNMERVVMELILRMGEEINKWDKYGDTVLMTSEEAIFLLKKLWACYGKMERVAMELIARMSEETINKQNNKGETALFWACINKMERVALELIPRMSKDAIKRIEMEKRHLWRQVKMKWKE